MDLKLVNNLTNTILLQIKLAATLSKIFLIPTLCIQRVLHYSGIVLTIFNVGWINIILDEFNKILNKNMEARLDHS